MPHAPTLILTHSDHDFLGFPWFLMPEIATSVLDFIQDEARCTYPYHVGHRLRRTGVISPMPNFRHCDAEGVSISRPLVLGATDTDHCSGAAAGQRHPVPTFHNHDDVIKWKPFPRNWAFVRGIHRSPVNSPHKGQWRGALMFYLICT